MSFTNPDDLDDLDLATATYEVITAVWTETLPAFVEQDLRSRATSTGTWYDDLLSLQNQYNTALTVLAQEYGITRPADASSTNQNESLSRSSQASTETTAPT